MLGGDPVVTDVHRGLWCDVDAVDEHGDGENGGGENSSAGNHLPPTRLGGNRVLVRGDIDALPIQTTLTTPYRSTEASVMHACGHDVHATCVLAAMQILLQLRRDDDQAVAALANRASVRFCFQPAEEDSTGGPLMVAAGATSGCRSAIALHTDPGRRVGTVGVRWGSFTAGCDVFYGKFRGRGGHGARPHLTDDALTAAIDFTTQIYQRVPRSIDARHPVVVNVGSLHAGTAPNVVPGEAVLSGTLRATTAEGRDAAAKVMQSIADSIAITHGCTCELSFGVSNPPVINDGEVVNSIQTAAQHLLGVEAVQRMTLPSMGAEDFAFIAAAVPGAMFRLGIATERVTDRETKPVDLQSADHGDQILRGHQPLHTPDFDVDPKCLGVGASVLAMSAIILSTDSEGSNASDFCPPA